MRGLASLGGMAIIAGMAAGQAKSTDFASDARPKAVVAQPAITVDVLPAPPISTRVASELVHTPATLLTMSQPQLIDIYKCGVPSQFPEGYTPGTVIMLPGSVATLPVSKLMKATVWQGKYVNDGVMTNRQFGVPAAKAVIYDGESWIDGNPSLIFDYENTSITFNRYRDEIREVSPGVYLGCMHLRSKHGPKVATWFALDVNVTRKKGCK